MPPLFLFFATKKLCFFSLCTTKNLFSGILLWDMSGNSMVQIVFKKIDWKYFKNSHIFKVQISLNLNLKSRITILLVTSNLWFRLHSSKVFCSRFWVISFNFRAIIKKTRNCFWHWFEYFYTSYINGIKDENLFDVQNGLWSRCI